MDYLKIIGGAAIGIGAIAAVPFTGGGSLLGGATLAASLTGAGTLAAAAGAGIAGAAAGQALSNNDKKKIEEMLTKQKVKHEFEKNKLVAKMNQILKDSTKIYDYIIAMHAIGLATANADGNISEEESQEIDEFVSGVLSNKFPENVKNQIKILSEDPPSLSTAYAFLEKADMTEQGWKNVEDLIDSVISADGYEDEKEIAFKEAWKVLRKTA
jgi:flavin-dependent dehydrogenase